MLIGISINLAAAQLFNSLARREINRFLTLLCRKNEQDLVDAIDVRASSEKFGFARIIKKGSRFINKNQHLRRKIMKNYTKLLSISFAVLLSIFASGIARAQADESNYAFVVFETTVTKKGVETSDKNPQERRFYVSNVVEFPERDASVLRNAAKIADEYFIANVVEPLEAKGILHQYYDDGIRINNNVVYRIDTRAEYEELQKKVLDELKEQNANVFTFNWTRDLKSAKGLETSQPKIFHRGSEQPLYMPVETKTVKTKV
jgi:hypothetical protein